MLLGRQGQHGERQPRAWAAKVDGDDRLELQRLGLSSPKKIRRKVLRLIRAKYSGAVGERFGPTLACEHLESEDSIQLSPTTIRRWMLAEGLWSRERKTRQHRKRRDRREHFGELVQLDGSFHEWLEKRGPRGCLMNLVDRKSVV